VNGYFRCDWSSLKRSLLFGKELAELVDLGGHEFGDGLMIGPGDELRRSAEPGGA
jgi:hypothetical protein